MSVSDSRQELNWAIACHLSALAGFIGLPFGVGNFIGPLIVWRFKKKGWKLVDYNGKEALNFQVCVSIVYCVVFAICLIQNTLGAIMLSILWWADLILVIMAAIKVNNGENFQYPFTIRFFK